MYPRRLPPDLKKTPVKILILIDWFAPAFKGGGPIQSIVNMVENNRGDFDYRIVCGNKDLDGTMLNVPADEWVNYNALTKVWYASSNRDVLKVVNETSREWKADALFINGLYSLHYNILPVLLAKAPRKIIALRGTLHDGALAQKSLKKKVFLAAWKVLRLHRKHEFHASNEEEKNFAHKVFGNDIKVSVAANFPKYVSSLLFPPKKSGHLRLVSVALISPMKNHLRVLEALGRCKSQIDYDIYGPVMDGDYWQKCLEEMKSLPANINVNYKGEVPPPQVENILATAHVFVLPSQSENFGHAIYEALISGKPVITSHSTPWNNLQDEKAGLNVSPNAAELTEAVEFFAAMPQDEFSTWSNGANRYAKARIDFEVIREEYKQMFLSGKKKSKPLAITSA